MLKFNSILQLFLKVWKISLQGPCYMTLLMITFGLLWGHLLQIRATQSVFIATCLSLSSTPLVSRFLAGSARGDKEGKSSATSLLECKHRHIYKFLKSDVNSIFEIFCCRKVLLIDC